MTAVHVMETYPKAFTGFTHNQPTLQKSEIHFLGTTNNHPNTDPVLAAAFSTAATTTAVLH